VPRITVGVGLLVLLLTLLPSAAEAADWTRPDRITGRDGARLDSLHQLSADGRSVHLIHPYIGGRAMDDRVLYQRSSDGGKRWSRPRTLFSAGRGHREVVANLALAARRDVVAAVWRTVGPNKTTLWIRVSRDGGDSWGSRRALDSIKPKHGLGVPAVSIVSRKIIAVAWTDRSDGRILVRVSRDGGRRFGKADRLGRTGLSIDCDDRVTDGLVGLTASRNRLYAAWSAAADGQCLAGSIKLRGSGNAGRKWGREVTVTDQRTYGWPELDAMGHRVIATVQSPDGIVVARSGDDGRRWRDRTIKARGGRNLSAADVVLLTRGRALITYVDERLRASRLVRTRVLSRLSRNDGASFRSAQEVAASAAKLRVAPNIAAPGGRAVVVVQSGPLKGSDRYIVASRQR
jgi:hypothetical protein